MSAAAAIRDRQPADAAWTGHLLDSSWGSTRVVSRGRLHDAATLPGLVATIEDVPAGLLTYRIEGPALEIVTLNSLRPGRGIGSLLLNGAADTARRAGCGRVWLVTTNDNLHALRFYQRRGFRMVALRADALAAARSLKPEIPLIGLDNIPLRDEIELEWLP